MQFKKAGILTTFQDHGRTGFQSFGINPNGAMDVRSMKIANILLGNSLNEGVVEMHFPAPTILFEEEGTFCLSGADFTPVLNENPIYNWETIRFKKGDTLKFIRKNQGERCYLAVYGGFAIQKWLDSVSRNHTANQGSIISKDTTVSLKKRDSPMLHRSLGHSLRPSFPALPTLRFIEGNEWEWLDTSSKQRIEQQHFTITKEANRMGYRLESDPLQLTSDVSLLSSAVTFGTMQLLPSGQLIILMADHQTTGGYPRIGTLCSVDLPKLAQCGFQQAFRLHKIRIEEAEKLFMEDYFSLKKLEASCRLLG